MLSNLQKNSGARLVVKVAIAFFVVTLVFTLHRYYTFYASFDQGIFNQVFWNSTQGRLFQSSLSSGLSTNVVHSGEVPDVSYHRLGQHFTPALLLWLPIYSLFPSPVTLSVLHVTLVTAAGGVLYLLARVYLQPAIASWIAVSYYAANAIAGPTLSNFHDNFQMPLFVFSLLLAMEKRWWWLFWPLALCILAVRADGGISLFGVGVYMTLSKRYPKQGLLICTLSFTYIALLTNLIMPLFSDDISRRFTIERFGQYVDKEEATTLEILWAFISQPGLVIWEIITPIGGKIKYLLGQWLPLAFIPAFSPSAWAIAGFPLLAIFLQQGQTALSINIRYAMTVVPGLFYGAILWWSYRQQSLQTPVRDVIRQGLWNKPTPPPVPINEPKQIPQTNLLTGKLATWGDRLNTILEPLRKKADHWWETHPKLLKISMQRFWAICIGLSLLFTFTSNPNRTFYFIIPDSINPWVYVSLPQQWQHSGHIRNLMSQIPPDASVSATTYLVPSLSGRREILRFPFMRFRNDASQEVNVEYAIADLWQLQQYLPAFKHDRALFRDLVPFIEQLQATDQYGIIGFEQGVVLMRRETPSDSEALAAWQRYREEIEPLLQPDA